MFFFFWINILIEQVNIHLQKNCQTYIIPVLMVIMADNLHLADNLAGRRIICHS